MSQNTRFCTNVYLINHKFESGAHEMSISINIISRNRDFSYQHQQLFCSSIRGQRKVMKMLTSVHLANC